MSNTLIISDLHLTNKWDEPKAHFLERVFSKADSVVINGDFWDGEQVYFDQFIHSPWKKFFPLLKKKKTVYIYGNHDDLPYSDKRVSLFSETQASSHLLEYRTYSCYIEHGHQLLRTFDIVLHLPRTVLFGVSKISYPVESFFVRHGSAHNVVLRISNAIMKKRMNIKQDNRWYICGHTHLSEIDKKNRYANSGFVRHGKASYLIANSSGLTLHTEWYK